MSFAIEYIDSCTSTNSILAERSDCHHGHTIACCEQTAGRGQRGNSWEAAPGENLTFSLLLRPHRLDAVRQFELSMIVSLAIVESLDSIFAEYGSDLKAKVKWPNDIYVGDKKICGILIENKLSGSAIERAIVGIGLNVNQTIFVSDAPNPTSIALLTGRLTPLKPYLEQCVDKIVKQFDMYDDCPDQARLKADYMQKLIRTSGQHPFFDEHNGLFYGHITDVDLNGMLTLSNGRKYAFKEVSFIFNDKTDGTIS